ncbi:ABC transporter substrate-binding protein [Candidatus Bipolaricaulota bacterium]|nr:ABC transporter substrate-binding protein [Candidatus Bipolaricaulota bacterium]
MTKRNMLPYVLRSLSLFILITLLVLLVGCGGSNEKKEVDEVTVQLKWVHQAQFAGFYAAVKEGFYAAKNIDADLEPGGPDLPPDKIIENLLKGQTDFAVVGGDQLLASRFRGQPVVAISVVFQKNPYVYATLKSSGIQDPEDLVGKKVMVSSDGEIIHRALLDKLGMKPEDIEEIPFKRDVKPLVSGRVDAHLVYRTATGLALEETGKKLNWIWIDNYGVHFYADTIVTTEKLVRENPSLVKRFLEGTIKGWRYSIENPKQAVEMTLQHDPSLSRNRQENMMKEQIPLIYTGETKLGWMKRGTWKRMRDILLEQKIFATMDIKSRAKAVARELTNYINDHPNMTLKELQQDPRAQEIAVQKVGKTGYTGVASAKTGRTYFHPKVVGRDPSEIEKLFPNLWEIFERAIGEPCQNASGFYEYAPEGEKKEKYMYIACVNAKTADGINLFVSATTYIDEYEVKRIDIDKAIDMQFLEEIYGEQ